MLELSNFVNKSDRIRPQPPNPPNLEILKLAKPAKKYKLQSCILDNPRLSTNQQYRTEEPKRSREKTKKQWLSSNSRFASVLTSDGAGIHRHATFICITYTRERGGRKNLTHSGITAFGVEISTFKASKLVFTRFNRYRVFPILRSERPLRLRKRSN